VAVANRTRWPAWAALMPKPIATWVLPVPGGPSRTRFRAAAMNAAVPRCARVSGRSAGWCWRLKSSRDLRAGKPAARIRSSAPEASRAETSLDSTAARYSSCVQDACRACSASRVAASRIRGALRARE
jgi:hypothetical protein